MPSARSTPPPPAEPPAFLSEQVSAARRFYRDLNPGKGAGLKVVCGGWEECRPDYVIDRRTFPYLSLEFVAHGRGELRLRDRTFPLGPGSVFTYGPGVAHRIRTDPAEPLGKYFVDFAGESGRRLLRSLRLSPGTLVELGASTEVRNAFDTLIRLAASHDRHADRACALQVELLLLVTARAAQPGSPSERRALATFERCRQHLDLHYRTLRTLEEAAAACHLDVSYLCRLFRRFHGEKPYRYLQRLQMQWAAERLDQSGRLVREVADELGIDPFQFSRTFKRVHGVSPQSFLRTRK